MKWSIYLNMIIILWENILTMYTPVYSWATELREIVSCKTQIAFLFLLCGTSVYLYQQANSCSTCLLISIPISVLICQPSLGRGTCVISSSCCSNWLRGDPALPLRLLSFRPSECHKDFSLLFKRPSPAVYDNRRGFGLRARMDDLTTRRLWIAANLAGITIREGRVVQREAKVTASI